MNKPGAIVLAAGKSSRMGQPKQLVRWEGQPMVVRAARVAREAGADPVWVVTGAHAAQVEALLERESFGIVRNRCFAEGMGTSITAGFKAAAQCPSLDSVFLLLCDQPAVHGGLLRRMREKALASGKSLVACAYAGTMGPPLLVARHYFDAFMATPPKSGAREVLRAHHDDLELIAFEAGAHDIDTPEDLH